MKNKTVRTMIIVLSVILLVGVITFVVLHKLNPVNAKEAPTIDEIVKNSIDIPEITTNLAGGSFIKIALKIETDNKKATAELEKRNFQVNDIVIDLLSDMKASDLDGDKGKEKLKVELKNRLNKVMQNGRIVNIYITSYIVQ